MNEQEYFDLQMGGDIIKPIRYHIGEWRAINNYSYSWGKHKKLIDVGCGVGYGVGMLQLLGFWDVIGFDMNPNKITVGQRLGYNVYHKNLMELDKINRYDVVWCSHVFEHMKNSELAASKLLEITKNNANFIFILPYPDLNPAPAHTASSQIGLDVDDKGKTVVEWFNSHRLRVNSYQFDRFRESEIWLECIKA